MGHGFGRPQASLGIDCDSTITPKGERTFPGGTACASGITRYARGRFSPVLGLPLGCGSKAQQTRRRPALPVTMPHAPCNDDASLRHSVTPALQQVHSERGGRPGDRGAEWHVRGDWPRVEGPHIRRVRANSSARKSRPAPKPFRLYVAGEAGPGCGKGWVENGGSRSSMANPPLPLSKTRCPIGELTFPWAIQRGKGRNAQGMPLSPGSEQAASPQKLHPSSASGKAPFASFLRHRPFL